MASVLVVPVGEAGSILEIPDLLDPFSRQTDDLRCSRAACVPG
jgi:hypothetical protein